MDKPSICADFNNADSQSSLRLNCVGTIQDLSRQGIALRDGLQLTFHDDELEAEGEVHFSGEEKVWVAIINWRKVRQQRS